MGVINVNGKNVALDAIGVAAGYMAMYSDVAATTEITGGIYARKAITWSPASNGSKAISNTPVFDIPAGSTVRAMGVCSALTAGTLYSYDDITPETYGGDGTYIVSGFTMTLTDPV